MTVIVNMWENPAVLSASDIKNTQMESTALVFGTIYRLLGTLVLLIM